MKDEEAKEKVTSRFPLDLQRLLRGHFIAVAVFSVLVNALMLVAPIYMMQIYDRIMTSGSFDALIWLTAIAIVLLVLYGVAEAGRRRTIALAGNHLEDELVPRIFELFQRRPNADRALDRNMARLSRAKTLFNSGSILPFFDLPFAPMFIALLFVIHPLLGVFGLVGTILVLIVAVLAETSTRDAGKIAMTLEASANELAQGLSRQRSAIVAMGLKDAVFARWMHIRDKARGPQMSASRGDNTFSAASRSLRQTLQILVLGISAALAISQEISMGSIIAGSIILSRALAPVDQIVGGWRNLIQAWNAWGELIGDIDGIADSGLKTAHPRPSAILRAERLSISVPGSDKPLIHPFTFEGKGGDFIAIMGANGAGKSSLLQTLAGAWQAASGSVTLGGRDLHAWPASDRGPFIGYVPQDVEILPGTIRDNIARFSQADDKTVFDTAEAALAHEGIMAMPDGYDTRIGSGGVTLSAGQRQLVGLARALFGNPVLLLLDEPTANLDSARVQSIIGALRKAADQGAIVIVATHDIRCVQASNTVLLVRSGQVTAADTRKYLEAAFEAHQVQKARRQDGNIV
jgi:PrtD family type I secretion system ABC transporter